MSFFSNLFGSKPKEPEKPKTREDMENSLSVRYQETRQHGRLQRAFVKRRPPMDAEKKLLTEMLDIISSTPEGKKLLDQTIKNGYSVAFDAFRGNSDGFMSGESKQIILCPGNHSSAAALAVTAFHEMVHGVQNERTDVFSNGSRLTMADQIKFQRATEAAACMEESRFAYQIKDAHPEVERHVSQFPMFGAYKAEMNKSGDAGKAGEAAFKAWYGYKEFQSFYEDQDNGNIVYALNDARKKGVKTALTGEMPSAEVLNTAFISADMAQKIDPAFLESKEAFSLSDESAKHLKAVAGNYAKAAGAKSVDASIDRMYSRETGEAFKPRSAENAAAHSKKSIMSALSEIDSDAKMKRTAAAKTRAGATR